MSYFRFTLTILVALASACSSNKNNLSSETAQNRAAQKHEISILSDVALCKKLRSIKDYLEIVPYRMEVLQRRIVCIDNAISKKLTHYSSKKRFSDELICSLALNPMRNGWSNTNKLEVQEALNRNLTCGIRKGSQPSTFELPLDQTLVDTSQQKYKRQLSPNDIAVIIGNYDYNSRGYDIPDVPPAKNDALAFQEFAINSLGIKKENIIFLSNATAAQLERTFGNERSFKGDAFNWVRKDKSNLFIYYAGHGAPGANGNSYIVPSDSTATSIELNGYPLKTLFTNLSKIPSNSTTVILESCFSGNSHTGSVIKNASPIYSHLKEESIPDNLTVISAGSANQLASWTQDQKHGLFTYHYIKGMSGAADELEYGNLDGKVSLDELQRYLDETVTYLARRYYARDQQVQINPAS